jgi:hypothetical protein
MLAIWQLFQLISAVPCILMPLGASTLCHVSCKTDVVWWMSLALPKSLAPVHNTYHVRLTETIATVLMCRLPCQYDP